MVFRGFRIECAIRVIALAATILLLSRLISRGQPVTLFVCAVLVVYQVVALVRYVEFTNRNLSLFLRSIEFFDFTQGCILVRQANRLLI